MLKLFYFIGIVFILLYPENIIKKYILTQPVHLFSRVTCVKHRVLIKFLLKICIVRQIIWFVYNRKLILYIC